MRKAVPFTGKQKAHAITEDQTATGHKRVTCACGANYVKQPWMKPADWTVGRREFIARHTP